MLLSELQTPYMRFHKTPPKRHNPQIFSEHLYFYHRKKLIIEFQNLDEGTNEEVTDDFLKILSGGFKEEPV